MIAFLFLVVRIIQEEREQFTSTSREEEEGKITPIFPSRCRNELRILRIAITMSVDTDASLTGPPPIWRLGSAALMSSIGFACRTFLYAFNDVEVTGLDHLLGVLDRRRKQDGSFSGRDRGLLTVCNHVGV